MDTIPTLLGLQRKVSDKGIRLRSYGNTTILHIYREHLLHNSQHSTRLPASLICGVSRPLSQGTTNQDKNPKTRTARSNSSYNCIPLYLWSHQSHSPRIRKCANLQKHTVSTRTLLRQRVPRRPRQDTHINLHLKHNNTASLNLQISGNRTLL